MHKYFSSSFKNKLHCLNKLYTSDTRISFNKLSQFKFSNSNQSSYDNTTEINQEDTIEVEPINNQPENEFKITDIYSIKSKRLGDPNIKKVIDSSKFQHNNVKLRVYDKEDYNKDPFKNSKMIPVSPKLGPFEVKFQNLK
jgi:hypothetical protein